MRYKNAVKKINAATKFIDFYVHDIVDYAILLRSGGSNFTKNITLFDIR